MSEQVHSSPEGQETAESHPLESSALLPVAGAASASPPPFSFQQSTDALQRQEAPDTEAYGSVIDEVVAAVATIDDGAAILAAVQVVMVLPSDEWAAFDEAFGNATGYASSGGASPYLHWYLSDQLDGYGRTIAMRAIAEYSQYFGAFDYDTPTVPAAGSDGYEAIPENITLGFDSGNNGGRTTIFLQDRPQIFLVDTDTNESIGFSPDLDLIFKNIYISDPNGEEFFYFDQIDNSFSVLSLPRVRLEGTYSVTATYGYRTHFGSRSLTGTFEVGTEAATATDGLETAATVPAEELLASEEQQFSDMGGIGEVEQNGLHISTGGGPIFGSESGVERSFYVHGFHPAYEARWYTSPENADIGDGTGLDTLEGYDLVQDPAVPARLGRNGSPVYSVAFRAGVQATRAILLLPGINHIYAESFMDGQLVQGPVYYRANVLTPVGEAEAEAQGERVDDIQENLDLVETGSMEPIHAVFVDEHTGAPRMLNLYVGRDPDDPQKAIFIDLSPGAEHMQMNFEGPAGVTFAESATAAAANFATNNRYPNGHISWRYDGDLGFTLDPAGVDTDAMTWNEWVNLWSGRLSIGLLIGAATLAVIGLPFAGIALAGSAVAGGVASSAAIADEMSQQNPNRRRIFIEGTSVVTTVIGLGGPILRGFLDDALRNVPIGGQMNTIIEAAEWTADRGEVIIMRTDALLQVVETIEDPTLDENERNQILAGIFTNAMMNEGVRIASTRIGALATENALAREALPARIGRLSNLEGFTFDFTPLTAVDQSLAGRFRDAQLNEYFSGVTDQAQFEAAIRSLGKVTDREGLDALLNHDLLQDRSVLRGILGRQEVMNGQQILTVLADGDYPTGQALLDAFNSGEPLPTVFQIGVDTSTGAAVDVSLRDIYTELTGDAQRLVEEWSRIGTVEQDGAGGLLMKDPNGRVVASIGSEGTIQSGSIMETFPPVYDINNILGGTGFIEVGVDGGTRTASFLVVDDAGSYFLYPLWEGNSLRLPGGPNLQLSSGETTVLLGKYRDRETSFGTQLLLNYLPEGMVSFGGEAPGGVVLLNIPPSVYENTESSSEFWDQFNEPFLETALQNGYDIQLISNPQFSCDGIFAMEISYLLYRAEIDFGYQLNREQMLFYRD